MPEEPATDSLEEQKQVTDAPETSGNGGEDAEDIDFSWSYDEEENGGADENGTDEDKQDEYVFDLGEKTQIPSEIHGELGGLAKELGIPGDKAAQLLNKGLEVYQAQFKEQNRQLGRELRKEWGKDFDARLKATKSFAVRLGREAGLKEEEMAVLMSPYGVRLMDAMRSKLDEGGGFAGRATSSPQKSREEQLDEFYANKEKMAAVLDPANPLHSIANKELNKLFGLN